MEEKITAHLFFMGIIAAVLAVLVSTYIFRGGFGQQVESDVRSSAELISEAYPYLEDDGELEKFSAGGRRITLINSQGAVEYDSFAEAGSMENHLDRPEVSDALKNGIGQSMRRSETNMTDVYYCAVRLDDGRVLRISMEAGNALSIFTERYPLVFWLVIALLILSVVMAVILTRKLVKPIIRLGENIDNVDVERDGEKIYPELAPFIEEIQAQRVKNRSQLKALAEEQEKLSAIIESMSEGLIVLDKEQRVLMVNQGAADYLGINHDPGRRNIVFLTRERGILDCAERAAGGEYSSATIDIGGRKLQVMASPVVSERQTMGVICFILDVTEKIQIEKMKQEFTANVSHELKTPLTSISGYAEMIETGMAKDEDIIGFAAKIHKEAGRLLVLISDIIRLSELDEIDGSDEVESVDLLDIANECVSTLALSAHKHRVVIKAEGVHTAVRGSRSMLTELVYNLCDNAIRYNKENGSVTVTVEAGKITVADTGIGIPMKYQHRIFERFYRVDKSRSKETGGTGLGLAIVKHIARQHGAEIKLTSVEGAGTSITVEFRQN